MTCGCFNRLQFVDTLIVQFGWIWQPGCATGKPRLVEIRNTGSRDCQYCKTTVDAGCVGCKYN